MSQEFTEKISKLQKKYDFINNNGIYLTIGTVISLSSIDTFYLRKYRNPNSKLNTYIQYGIGVASAFSVIQYINYHKRSLNSMKEEYHQFRLRQLSGKI